MFEVIVKQDRITAKDPHPTAFSVPKRRKKSWWCEEEGDREGEEKVHLLTHATARGVGKNVMKGREGEEEEEDMVGLEAVIDGQID